MKQRKFLKTGHTVFVYYAVDYRVPCIYNRSLILSLIMSFFDWPLTTAQHSGDLETILICLQRTNSSGNPL